jgi:hypothetical protein
MYKNLIFLFLSYILYISSPSGPPREFLGPRAKGNLAPSSNSPNIDTQTKSTTCVISMESVQQK